MLRSYAALKMSLLYFVALFNLASKTINFVKDHIFIRKSKHFNFYFEIEKHAYVDMIIDGNPKIPKKYTCSIVYLHVHALNLMFKTLTA